MKIILKLLRIILGIFLIPFCIGSVIALYYILLSTGSAHMIWSSMLAGVATWLLIYFFLPEPKWLYVLGHELTHALWSWGFGGKLKKIKVNSDGGHVLITKANFLTSLAPYFFPLYVVLIVIIFVIGNYFWNWNPYILWFYFLIGMMYAFHITLTVSTLKIKQPDIVQEGYIFSAVVIFLGNVLILLVGIPLLTNKMEVSMAINLWLSYSAQIYNYLSNFI
ncbi:MAG: M50 family metallopeptidase [Candidatus Paceibacterota bacterium]